MKNIIYEFLCENFSPFQFGVGVVSSLAIGKRQYCRRSIPAMKCV